MKQKDMKRSDWHRILSREYRCAPCSYQGLRGIASVLLLKAVSEPLTIRYEHGNVTIAQAGHTWVQVAFENTYFWATAMFDERNQLLQIYFDLTNGNCLRNPENPTFEDSYLDIVMEADGTLHLLDRDELDAAYQAGEMTREQYLRTIREGEKLYRYLREHGQEFAAFCRSQLLKLK